MCQISEIHKTFLFSILFLSFSEGNTEVFLVHLYIDGFQFSIKVRFRGLKNVHQILQNSAAVDFNLNGFVYRRVRRLK